MAKISVNEASGFQNLHVVEEPLVLSFFLVHNLAGETGRFHGYRRERGRQRERERATKMEKAKEKQKEQERKREREKEKRIKR